MQFQDFWNNFVEKKIANILKGEMKLVKFNGNVQTLVVKNAS